MTKFLLRKVPTIAAISGLGSVFIAAGFKAMIRRKIVVFWYWLSFVGSNALIVFKISRIWIFLQNAILEIQKNIS